MTIPAGTWVVLGGGASGSRCARRALVVAAMSVTLVTFSSTSRADDAPATVVLVGGARVRGTITLDDPKTGVTVRLPTGKTRTIPRKQVERVDYPEPEPAPAPPPAVEVVPLPAPVAPLPPPSHIESHHRKALWITGLAIDVGVWAIRAAITVGICGDGGSKCDTTDYAGAATPVFGGFIGAANNAGDYAPALITSGIIETAGFTLLILGLVMHHDTVVYDSRAVSLQVTPAVLDRGSGLALTGRF